jgi:hypothetical protein
MKKLMFLISLVLVACGESGERGREGVGAGINTEPARKEVCSNGGVVITTFRDFNNDNINSVYDITISVNVICNGTNGTSLTIEQATSCPNGGVKIRSTTSTIDVCGGLNGVNGLDGTNGLNGADGTAVTPIKFCNDDHTKYPEYGLLIDDKLFAVYWGATPASKNSQAFLAEITPGTYKSTGGNNCTFTITENLEVAE